MIKKILDELDETLVYTSEYHISIRYGKSRDFKEKMKQFISDKAEELLEEITKIIKKRKDDVLYSAIKSLPDKILFDVKMEELDFVIKEINNIIENNRGEQIR